MGWNVDGMKVSEIKVAWPKYIGLEGLGMEMQWNGTDEKNELEVNDMYWEREGIVMEWIVMTRMVSKWLLWN